MQRSAILTNLYVIKRSNVICIRCNVHDVVINLVVRAEPNSRQLGLPWLLIASESSALSTVLLLEVTRTSCYYHNLPLTAESSFLVLLLYISGTTCQLMWTLQV